jgi:hypothetical protein
MRYDAVRNWWIALVTLALLADGTDVLAQKAQKASPRKPIPKASPGKSSVVPQNKPSAPAPGNGWLNVDVTDVLGHDLHARVELQREGIKNPVVIDVPKGRTKAEAPVGTYKAYTSVYCLQVPVLIDAQDVAIKADAPAFLLVNLLEGAAGSRTLLDFDQDCDFALDSVEAKCGTDPKSAASIPGRETLPMDERVFEKKEAWYRGELHAHSSYGGGKETVQALVQRAEKAGLDFLAITDRNTVAACKDPGFKSRSVVLIPALEWGDEKRGVALIYGARTFPPFVNSIPQAQALVDLVQAQGGFFAIAHPCFPTAPWQWGLGYVNGIEVWCREWRAVPPMSLDQLDEDLKERLNGKLTQSIAYAAASTDLSANGQSSIFYDAELVRGLKAAVIGGSNTSSPEVPMGQPATCVFAKEKSVKGILDGMRRGRTYVSASLTGPKLHFSADVLKDQTIDVSLGGIIPLSVPVRFIAQVENAKGKELQILLNGHPLISKRVESDPFTIQFDDTPENYAEYRVRVTGVPTKEGFGPVDVLAVSSPIYAQEIDLPNPKLKAFIKQKAKEPAPPIKEIPLPSDPGPGEIKPKTLM